MKRILLVEDSSKDVELTLAALAESQLDDDVFVVRDGEEALDYLYSRGDHELRHPGTPVVVLLDVKLPKLGGLEVLEALRRDSRLKTLPIVMLTSSREERDVVTSYRLGANAYVVKPVDFQEFVEAVKEVGIFWGLVNEPPPGETLATS